MQFAQRTGEGDAYLGPHHNLLCLVAPPAALNPDGGTLGLQEVHPSREGSEGCLQQHYALLGLQIRPALVCSPADGL